MCGTTAQPRREPVAPVEPLAVALAYLFGRRQKLSDSPNGYSSMDLEEMIRLLKRQKERIERSIQALEEYLSESQKDLPPFGSRRGRKSMAPDERREVSERMKKYWAKRRGRKPE